MTAGGNASSGSCRRQRPLLFLRPPRPWRSLGSFPLRGGESRGGLFKALHPPPTPTQKSVCAAHTGAQTHRYREVASTEVTKRVLAAEKEVGATEAEERAPLPQPLAHHLLCVSHGIYNKLRRAQRERIHTLDCLTRPSVTGILPSP